MIWQLFTGLDFTAPIDVLQEATRLPEDLSATTIVASLLSSDGSTELITDTAQSSGTIGASWSTGRLVVVFPAASTGLAAVVAAIGTTLRVGVKITSGGLTQSLTLIPVEILKGY